MVLLLVVFIKPIVDIRMRNNGITIWAFELLSKLPTVNQVDHSVDNSILTVAMITVKSDGVVKCEVIVTHCTGELAYLFPSIFLFEGLY
jgi:hypothetical protein